MSYLRNAISSYTALANATTALEQIRQQYAEACPDHTYKTRIYSIDPLVIYLDNYITAQERYYIQASAESMYEQSQVADADDDPNVYMTNATTRSSQSAYFYDDPVTTCIRERSATFQGHIPVANIEDLQAVKYTVGDQFRQHVDWWADAANPRVSTFFAYLGCDGEAGAGRCEGGATRFPELRDPGSDEWCDVVDCDGGGDDGGLGGVAFKPVAGNAIYWSNVYPDGEYHYGTTHAGMPIRKGRKVGLNIWSRKTEFVYTE